MNLRAATVNDDAAIAYVQKTAWQSTYPGIMKQMYLDTMDLPANVAGRVRGWHARLSQPGTFAFAAENDAGQIIGFVWGGPARENSTLPERYDGELYDLYVLKDYQGQGIGRQLLTLCAQTLASRGYGSMLLWAVKNNHPARGFYERMGGVLRSEMPVTLGTTELVEVSYGWRDLSVFQEYP